MLISTNWLKKFVNIPASITPEKLAELLTLSTVEVEEVRSQGALLNNVVVGKVLKLEDHPNADKLKLAVVGIGTKKEKVVCGGVNLKKGMLVAFAKVGAKVKWHGEGEPVVLEKAKIRGIESSGMICSASELELENIFPQESEYHIINLSDVKKLKIGKSLASALSLDDTIIEIENKSLTNRPDLWSHYGLAREVAALTGAKLKPQTSNLKHPTSKKDKLIVEIKDNQKCPRYLGVVVSNIKIEPSPMWLAKQLEAVGVRPINNIVDITNYVLMELGQPLHAFDYNNIKNHKIIVRTAKRGEKIKTLDDQIRTLDSDDLLIADSEAPVALAGVMGGANSEINDSTKKIIIESANFEASGIRRTETRTGLRSEASIRFEKALPPELAEEGINRALELILELIPSAKITSSIIDAGTYKPKKNVITLNLDYLNRLVGEDIAPQKVIQILESLGFKTSAINDKQLTISIPPFRATRDITIEEDLIEEVARIYGYENLKPEMPHVKLTPPKTNTERKLERQIKNILTTGFSFQEVENYAYIDPKIVTHFGFKQTDLIELENPISPEQSHLRPSLLINLAKNIKDNLRYINEFKLFEIGRVFINAKLRKECETTKMRNKFNTDLSNKEFLPCQDKFLSGVIVGNNVFEEIKSAIENLSQEIDIDIQLVPTKVKVHWAEWERLLEIKSNNKTLGYVSELCPSLRTALKLASQVGVFELNFTELANLPKQKTTEFTELPIYPSVTRDVAIIVSQGNMYSDIAEAINAVSPLIVEVELFDVYTGKNITAGQRSLAFHITFRAPDRTLEAKEVDKIFEKVVSKLEEKFKAKLRD
ncbi:phenylalanine--tRNA ligase subunit beta [Candidatus Falkowbacteria bacterium]|nr:phenylalanine--tRNA ligase subunit beta [Candidatus Falkowbacteria bacterium]